MSSAISSVGEQNPDVTLWIHLSLQIFRFAEVSKKSDSFSVSSSLLLLWRQGWLLQVVYMSPLKPEVLWWDYFSLQLTLTYFNIQIYFNLQVCSLWWYQFSSVQLLSRVWLFATPRIAACQASLSITNSRSSPRLMSIESVMPSSHLILCRPLLLLPPIPPSIRVFSNKSTLCMR